MQKQQESIWTKDLTPGFVRVMTMDVTPDFGSAMWTKDISHHVVATLAIFGLVVSAGVMTLGVATVGVNVELAFAQQESATQTALLAFGGEVPPSAALLPLSSTTEANPPMHPSIGQTVESHVGTTTHLFCPQILHTISRGNHEGTTTGAVGQLQQFIATHFNLDPNDVVTGHFGSTTQAFLERFQQEQGIPQAPFAGPLTRAAIARLCVQGVEHHEGGSTGSSTLSTQNQSTQTPGIQTHMDGDSHNGSTTPPMPPTRPNIQVPPTTSNVERHDGAMPVPQTNNPTNPSNTRNAASSTVTVQVISPNGGENYHAGSGDPLTVSWVAAAVPQGAKACVTLISSKGKRFAFPGTGERCVAVSNGAGSITGQLVLTNDYVLTVGSYVAQVTIIPSTGTEAGILAQDSSNSTFTLDDAELGISSNTSNAASIIDAMTEIGDGYSKLMHAGLSLFGL